MAVEDFFFEGLGPSIRALDVVVRELAHNRVPVLILAEAGTGKRMLARRIHDSSDIPSTDFKVLSCARTMPEEFDQDFGSGTLFLQEIGDLALASQAKLAQILSGIQGKENTSFRARLICGSARELEPEVRLGKFREDVYYRISGVCLRLPPLRQRSEDLMPLTNFLLRKYAREFGRPVPVLSPQTEQLFKEYSWPGNIRELSDAVRAIVVLGDESLAMGGLRAILTRTDSNHVATPDGMERVSLKQAARAASREAEKELILKALTRTRWNRRRAAQDLQISYKALLYKLKQIGFSNEVEAS